MTHLDPEQLKQALTTLPGWSLQDGRLQREYKFSNFVAAMGFVNQVAAAAEQAGHHPDIDIRYSTVTLGLVTHDAGGITSRDVEMAARLSSLT